MAWLNCDFLYTYNCMFNQILGPRGHGKTYWGKKRVIKNFLKSGEEFIYLRRRVKELDMAKENIYQDIIRNQEFKDHEIMYNKFGYYMVDGEIAGYPMALSDSMYRKGNSFANVYTILFDEYTIDERLNQRYLKNEIQQFLTFYDTIDRKEDRVKVFFLGNSYSFLNPYTSYWKMKMPKPGKVTRSADKNCLVYNDFDEEFMKDQLNTTFGSMVEGTTYGNMSLNNMFINDNYEFIEKKTGQCSYCFGLKHEGEYYGVWANYASGLLYVSKDIEPTSKLIYSITMDDHTPNTLLIGRNKSVGFLRMFTDSFAQGHMRFDNMEVKSACYEIVSILKGY